MEPGKVNAPATTGGPAESGGEAATPAKAATSQGADYDARLAGFCEAMKTADPAVKLLSSYPSPARLKSAGQWLDYTCPHHYGCADLAGMECDFDRLLMVITCSGNAAASPGTRPPGASPA